MAATFHFFAALPAELRNRTDVTGAGADSQSRKKDTLQAAARWGITPQQHQRGPCLFARPFDGVSDVLYVADDKWLKFYFEPTDRMAEPDLINQNLDLSSHLTRVAVSETLFMRADVIAGLPEIQVWFMHLTVLFVVVGAQPDETRGPYRWQLENTKGGAFHWHVEDETFRFERGHDTWMEEDVYTRIGEVANGGLREAMKGEPLHHQGLETRPIFVSRK